MKIIFLHLTLGLIERGSEISTDIIASELSTNNQVFVLGGGDVSKKKYSYKKIGKIRNFPKAAPTNILEKILFRLYLDSQSQQVKKFTKLSLKEIRKFDPDIIIPINGKPQIKIISKYFPNKKICTFGHAGIGWNDIDTLKTQPDLFIALSQNALKWAKKIKKSKTKVINIPNPVDINHFKNAKFKKINLTKPIVIIIGALTKYKNIDLVIKAVAKTKASLLVLGKGEEEKNLKKLAQKLLPNRHLFAYSKYMDISGYLKASNVFCFMPDSQEAFGRVYIEAMASGLPIVAPNDSIRKGIIGNQGFYSNYNLHDIAKHINKALKVDKINYSKELEEFSSEKVVKDLERELDII